MFDGQIRTGLRGGVRSRRQDPDRRRRPLDQSLAGRRRRSGRAVSGGAGPDNRGISTSDGCSGHIAARLRPRAKASPAPNPARSAPRRSGAGARHGSGRRRPALPAPAGANCRCRPAPRHRRRRCRSAIRSPASSRGRSRSSARKSPVSQTGPTTSAIMRGASAGGCTHRPDVVEGVVERRPDQVVHRRVDDDEVLGVAFLHVDDFARPGCRHCRRSAGPARRSPCRPSLATCFLTISA